MVLTVKELGVQQSQERFLVYCRTAVHNLFSTVHEVCGTDMSADSTVKNDCWVVVLVVDYTFGLSSPTTAVATFGVMIYQSLKECRHLAKWSF